MPRERLPTMPERPIGSSVFPERISQSAFDGYQAVEKLGTHLVALSSKPHARLSFTPFRVFCTAWR